MNNLFNSLVENTVAGKFLREGVFIGIIIVIAINKI
jgi:hypothetical protein